MYVLSITNDIKFAVLDLLRSIGMGLINIIFNTIDVLYDVAHKINSLNFIRIMENIDNSPFTKIFNSFFILAFAILFLFAVWKITFKIFDADENQDQSLMSIIKEIFKCGFLIFSVYLIFNQGINLGINLSNAIYNSFTNENSTIGDKMKTAYLSINENCYYNSGNESYHKDMDKVDKDNVTKLKTQLSGYVSIPSSVTTVEHFTPLIRNGTLTATNITDSGAFSLTCQIYKAGIWNDGEDYFFNYNWVFGIIIGIIFLFAIGFSVIMLGRRQLELSFLMLIAPLVFATSIGRKEQRSALYQQLVSLVLQSGALLLLIGLTSIMFNAIQNSADINALPYFTKIVAQSVLYLGCAMMLLTGSTALNRFIGENVSANSGRDTMMAMKGMLGGMVGASAVGYGAIKGGSKALHGTGRMANATRLGLLGSSNGQGHSNLVKSMNSKLSKAQNKIDKGKENVKSSNPINKLTGLYQQHSGQKKIDSLNSKWDFDKENVKSGYFTSGKNMARDGLGIMARGFTGNFQRINNYENYRKTAQLPIRSFRNDTDKL